MENRYQHTQVGRLMMVTFLLAALIILFVFIQAGFEQFSLFFMLILLFIAASFISLTVTIDEQYIRIKFGYGFISRKFELSKIVSAEKVKNKWYYGWGIRLWLWPPMVIFNVSGLDAIELKMKNGRTFRIGTDDPDGFEAAIKTALQNNLTTSS